ncbi:MAG TPA: OB-fold domain-containing protein [Gaiellaceae bacterium]|nr:OB-fold domain-containing protein [Gaiellaceae bacterium]
MTGILDAAACVPRHRLPAELVGASWRRTARVGSRAVANADEDSFTLAATAADWLLTASGLEVDAVYFASTTAPYREKLISPMIAAVADQPASVATADFSGSLRAGLSALAGAADAVASGRLRSVAVAAADCRTARPGAELDYVLGDAGAAVVVGRDEEAIATIDAHVTRSDDFLHVWRRDGDRFVTSGDARFARVEGYLKNIVPVVQAALERAGISARDVQHAIVDGPDASSIAAAAKALELSRESAVDPLLGSIGHGGAAHSLLLLTGVLDRAQPGERILVTGYGDGADALVLTATDRLASRKPARPLDEQVQAGIELDSYQRYLVFRGLVAGQEESERPFSSISLLRRTAKQDVRLYGGRCRNCGRVQYPIPRICRNCRSDLGFDEVKLERRGTVFTLTEEHYFPSPDPPVVVAVLDLEGGGRLVLQGTDGAARDVEIGSSVELVYRRHHEGGGFHNYYWKYRTVNGGSG